MTLSMQEFRYEIDCYALDRTKARGPRLIPLIDSFKTDVHCLIEFKDNDFGPSMDRSWSSIISSL
ncbi:hypothetical protein QR98_0018580 [Sarcoptes scabiei]|uniref:Uncharacterized protein n=1 Tax=Sarcoptes scabiei TaxID=52283 RepID=A0A131ZXN4_SARSC|nr:hypothetical protein QR98_0018580 [Sarcoptes scabiei]